MRVQEKIMRELEGIPVSKLNELYEFIYYYKLGLLKEIDYKEKEFLKNIEIEKK